MSRLGDSSFELFRLNPLLKHRNLVLVKVFNAVDDHLFLQILLFLGFAECALFFEELILLEIGCEFVDFLAESYLLRVPLVHQRLLLVEEFLFELLFADLLELHFARQLFFNASLFSLTILVAVLLLQVVSFQKTFVFSLLLHNALHDFGVFFRPAINLTLR